jgi:hypothetical protein
MLKQEDLAFLKALSTMKASLAVLQELKKTTRLQPPVHLTACSALSSDHLPILIDTTCRSSFLNPPDRPDFKRTDWSKFQVCLDNNIPIISETVDEASIDACVENLTTGAVFLDVAKALDTVWVDGLAYKLMALNFPSYLVKTI